MPIVPEIGAAVVGPSALSYSDWLVVALPTHTCNETRGKPIVTCWDGAICNLSDRRSVHYGHLLLVPVLLQPAGRELTGSISSSRCPGALTSLRMEVICAAMRGSKYFLGIVRLWQRQMFSRLRSVTLSSVTSGRTRDTAIGKCGVWRTRHFSSGVSAVPVPWDIRTGSPDSSGGRHLLFCWVRMPGRCAIFSWRSAAMQEKGFDSGNIGEPASTVRNSWEPMKSAP